MRFIREDVPSELLPNVNPSGNIRNIFVEINLTHFWPIFSFYTSWKHQKTKGLLVFLRGIKWEVLVKNGLRLRK